MSDEFVPPVEQRDIFKARCETDPQGVIKDLLGQSSRQAKEIHTRGKTIETFDIELSVLWKTVEKNVSPEQLAKIHEQMEKHKKKCTT